MYNEEDFLQLSGIQHFVFCRRQWALAYIEMQWEENVRTFEGRQLHKKAHDVSLKEKRGDVIIERAMPIHSRELGISGECDVVEFYESPNGVKLSGHTGKYIAIPIEYKHGRPKTNEADILQLTSQAICIEEMLCCDIPYGYIYYGETRHRQKVEITVELRQKVKMIFEEMHKYYKQRYTPKVKRSKSCNACSLKDVCLPMLNKSISVTEYIDKKIKEGVEDR